jgi:geranylgeranyl diphosphate/geranylgeranyl-bacteriochlorophyllide a reductase
MSNNQTDFDVIVVGGGPSGATAAHEIALAGHRVLLLERAFRIKPCGGAIPPCMLEEFDIPRSLLKAEIQSARMISPTVQKVDMPIEGTFVGMVDRDEFDPWLRSRAQQAGAELELAAFKKLEYLDDETIQVTYVSKGHDTDVRHATARCVLGADGARSKVARQGIPTYAEVPWVLAYHEIVKAPDTATENYDPQRCEVWYQGKLSPDFYAWVFPHGNSASIGVGSALKDFSAQDSVSALRTISGLDTAETIRKEGAPIPMKPMKRWDDGKGVLVSGDAAGVVAPASGEGIYYAMLCGRLSADAVNEFLLSGKPAALKAPRKRFMKLHGRTFWALGLLQYFWYHSDKRREQFVEMCKDEDVQTLTWQSYTQKKLVKKKRKEHLRVFVKDIAQLLGLSKTAS